MKGFFLKAAMTTVFLVVGYLLTLHAGMNSDQDAVLTWYYKLEFALAGILCWPISLYLWVRGLIMQGAAILGFEVVAVHYFGYMLAFGVYSKYLKNQTRPAA